MAILAALEHGSHTVSELAIVTAMSGAIIKNNLRRLQQAGTITRTKRAGDGKAAYALTRAGLTDYVGSPVRCQPICLRRLARSSG